MHQLESDIPDPDWQTLSPAVDELLTEMPARDRDAVLLRVVDERSFVEIGRGMGISESGARMRFERALDKLRLGLARRGVTSTATALAMGIGQQAGAVVPGTWTSVVASTAASTGLSAGGVPSIIAFMSTTKVTMAALGFVALAAAISSVHQMRTAQRAESALAVLAVERNQLRARLLAADSVGKGAFRSAAPSPKSATPTAAAKPVSAPGVEPALRHAAWAPTSAINVALESLPAN